MKIRTGFVSNSSSTSFIIIFPEGFDATTLSSDADAKKLLRHMQDEGELWESQVEDILEDPEDEYGEIENLIEPYKIAQKYGASEDGAIIVVNTKKVKDILGM